MRNKFAALAGTVLLAGAAFAAAPSASARAAYSANSPDSYGSSATCSTASDGWFAYDGDITYIVDTCKDGWSGVLEVDEQPTGTDSHYDYTVWANNGVGSYESHVHNIDEGRTVCVRAGVGHPSTGVITGLGSWECGAA
jgi:hypothetical protein